MKPSTMRVFALTCVLLIACSGPILAAPAPAVAKQIPADTAWALFLNRPGDSLPRIGAVIDRFKNVHPDMSWSKIGADLKKELGENVLSADGMQAFGLDPEGTVAIYSRGFEGEPNLVLPLSDAKRFVDKMFGLAEKNGTAVDRKATKRAGARVYKLAGDEFAVTDKWCLIFPKPGRRVDARDPVKAFFGRGKKLAGEQNFKSALSSLPPGSDGLAYLAMAAAAADYGKSTGEMIARFESDLKNAPDSRKKWMKESLAGMKQTMKDFSGLLAKFKGVAGGFRVEAQRLSGTVFLAARPAGQKELAQVFPATSGQPAFHDGLSKGAIAGGWASLKALPLVTLAGALPTSPYRSLEMDLQGAARSFSQTFQMDFKKDLLGNLRDPVAAYLFSPDLSSLDPKAPMADQFVPLFQFAALLRVDEPAKAVRFLARLDELARSSGKPFEQKKVGGTQISKIRPKAGVALNWALFEDVILFGLGENTVERCLERMARDRWTKPAGRTERGLSFLDLPALSETISSAVSKGIGGESGLQFRMAWPMFQQALAKLGRLSMQGQLIKGGAIIHSGLTLH